VQSFVDAGAMTLEAVPYPYYYAHLPEDAAPEGRVIQPAYPPGWRRGVDPTGGQLLVDLLLGAARERGAEVLLEHEVVHLVRGDDGEVVGVEARTGRRTVLVGARRGVVFASGGFLHDEALAHEHLRGPVLGGAAAGSATSDFVRIGIEAGAPLGNMNNAWWDQVVVELAAAKRATSHDVYSPFGDSMLMVNRYGRRVVNEKAPYNERGQIRHVWDPSRMEHLNLLLFMIFDDDVLRSPSRSPARASTRTSAAGRRRSSARGPTRRATAVRRRCTHCVRRALPLRDPRPGSARHQRGAGDRRAHAGARRRRHADPGPVRRRELRRVAGRAGVLGAGRHDRTGGHVRLPGRPPRGRGGTPAPVALGEAGTASGAC
jgi:hypothetical protein